MIYIYFEKYQVFPVYIFSIPFTTSPIPTNNKLKTDIEAPMVTFMFHTSWKPTIQSNSFEKISRS